MIRTNKVIITGKAPQPRKRKESPLEVKYVETKHVICETGDSDMMEVVRHVYYNPGKKYTKLEMPVA
jgi:hypothetical protein